MQESLEDGGESEELAKEFFTPNLSQDLQLSCLTSSLNLPLSHVVHSLAPGLEAVPSAQLKQAVRSPLSYFPPAQEMQMGEPVEVAMVPVSQAVQVPVPPEVS